MRCGLIVGGKRGTLLPGTSWGLCATRSAEVSSSLMRVLTKNGGSFSLPWQTPQMHMRCTLCRSMRRAETSSTLQRATANGNRATRSSENLIYLSRNRS